MPNDKLKNYLHLHLIVFIWGFTAVLGALISIEAIPLVWYRMTLATVIIGLYVLFVKARLRFGKTTIFGFCFAGFLIALHWLCFFGAIKASNVSITLAVMSTGAFFTAFLEPLLYWRRIVWYEVIFGFLAMVGLYIIFDVETEYTMGLLLALAASFLGALFTVINGRYAVKYSATSITFYELGFGALCISLYLLYSGDFANSGFFELSTADWWYLILLASVCTAYAFIASVHVMKWISPFTVVLTVNLEPVYGILLALVILGDSEQMSPQFYYGALLILAAVLANGFIKIRKSRKRTAQGS
ncbi:MAG: DMT family transporter [Gilvibacter sp.]